MAETTWDVLSVRDANGEPILSNCLLMVGDHVLEFKNGVSQAPESVLGLIANDQRVKIPGYKGQAPQSVQDQDVVQVEATDDVESDLEEQLAEDDAVLGKTGETKPGKASLTEDGKPRCQAVKSDGTQCANVATKGPACGLSSHRSQLT